MQMVQRKGIETLRNICSPAC